MNTPDETSTKVLKLIERRHRQLLIHSYLYYKLNMSIIEDATFDRWCAELVELHREHPELAECAEYYNVCKNFDQSGSGFFIRSYPMEIMATALRLLWVIGGSKEPFENILAREGLAVIKN